MNAKKVYKYTVLLTQGAYAKARKEKLWKFILGKDYTFSLEDTNIVALVTDNTQLVLDLAELIETK